MIVKKFRVYRGIILKRVRLDLVDNICRDYKCEYCEGDLSMCDGDVWEACNFMCGDFTNFTYMYDRQA